jgi:hypothetical protein
MKEILHGLSSFHSCLAHEIAIKGEYKKYIATSMAREYHRLPILEKIFFLK